MPTYYAIITDAGQALLADAMASGQPVVLTQFGVGDGGGVPVVPDPAMTALTNEVYRGGISSQGINPEQPNSMVTQLVIPKESGGYTVREVALFTDDGTMFSIGNNADQPKPPPESGYAVKLDIRYTLVVSDTSAITVVIQPGDYLTEERANTLYLQIGNNLSEIAAAGPAAQQEARANIDAAPRSDLSLYYSKHRVNQVTHSEIFNRFGEALGRGSYLFRLATYGTTGQSGAWYTLWVNTEGVMGLTLLWESAAEVLNQPELFIQDNRLYVRTNDPDTLYDVMVAVEECEIDAAHKLFDFYKQLYSETHKPTPAEIEAAPAVHGHTPGEVGAYPMTGGTLNGPVSAQGEISSNSNIVAQGYVREGDIRVYSPNNPPPASAGDALSDIALGAQGYAGLGAIGDGEHRDLIAPVGCVLTGLNFYGKGVGSGTTVAQVDGIYYRPEQKLINGVWVTVGHIG